LLSSKIDLFFNKQGVFEGIFNEIYPETFAVVLNSKPVVLLMLVFKNLAASGAVFYCYFIPSGAQIDLLKP
jgi:hypothetical protein